MKKNLLVMASWAVLASMALVMASCGKDDGDSTPTSSELSFEKSEETVHENDGTIEIKLTLDKPAPESFVVEYEIDGTAIEKSDAPEQLDWYYDYEIVGGEKEVEFAKGATEAVIKLTLNSDYVYESLTAHETIELSLDLVDSDLIDISGANDEIVIDLVQEDGTIVILDWFYEVEHTGVDMDLLFWAYNEGEDSFELDLKKSSASSTTDRPEAIFIPTTIPDNLYGLSYTYWGGPNDLDTVRFRAIFADVTSSVVEEEEDIDVFTAKYTAANMNKWDSETEGKPFNLAQVFVVEEGAIAELSEAIDVAETSSRQRTYLLKTNGSLRKHPSDIQAIKTIREGLLK